MPDRDRSPADEPAEIAANSRASDVPRRQDTSREATAARGQWDGGRPGNAAPMPATTTATPTSASPAAETPRTVVPQFTERMLLDRLKARYTRADRGNGPEWVYLEHVRDQTGFANRTIDALALHLWRSRHHEVHAFEVKVSRSDFRRELLHECAKSATWTEWVEYFWIVAPAGVVPRDELPETWGLLHTQGDGLRVAKPAVRLREESLGYMPSPDLPRSVVACMLRSAARLAAAEEAVDGVA